MMVEGWTYVGLGTALLAVVLTVVARKYNEWTCAVRVKAGEPPLPAGSMGWPLLGESLHFMTCEYYEMYKQKFSKYGRTWKTHYFGSPTICTSTAESARQVLIGKQGLFEAYYPTSMSQILGPYNFMFLTGADHMKVKRFFLAALRPESIRSSVGQVEKTAMLCMKDLDGKTISVLREARLFSFNAVISLLFGESPSEEMDKLWEEFGLLEKAIFNLPINLPGTAFRKGLQARERIVKFLKQKIEQRRFEIGVAHHDVMDLMMKSIDGETLSDAEIIDNLLAGLFAGQDTSATALHWAVYHLSQNPEALEDLRDEMDRIQRSKREGEPLNWDDVKSMPMSSAVLNESVRLSVSSYLMRQAQTDVVIEGYTIPKGWRVVTWLRFFHTDPANFKDPLAFNPRRHLETPKPQNLHIFGAGVRVCPGVDFSRLEVAAFFYHLLTKYTWEVIPNPKRKIVTMPVPHLSDGLQIRVHKRMNKPEYT